MMGYEDSYLLDKLQNDDDHFMEYQELMLHGDSYDDYNQQDFALIYLKEGSSSCLSCMLSTVSQTINNLLLTLLTANLSLLIIYKIFKDCRNTKNFSTVVIGQATIYLYLQNNKDNDNTKNLHPQLVVPILISVIAIISNTLFYYVRRSQLVNWISWTIGILTILFNELFIYVGHTELLLLRPILMVISMKYISLNTDKVRMLEVATKKKDVIPTKPPPEYFITILSDLAYLSHPASSILGSWHPQFAQSCTDSISFRNLLKVFYALLKSFIYLVISTCLAGYLLDVLRLALIHYVPSNNTLDIIMYYFAIYLVALEFRFSHYFSCQLTYAMFLMWNCDLPVSQPCEIELPRSLVQVVVCWNRPMHLWLKTYTFLPLREHTSTIILPVLSTYILSSILHGFKFEIWSVLLLLGIYTWIEHHLRQIAAIGFDACVTSRKCDISRGGRICLRRHSNTQYGSTRTKFINSLFAITALAHLTFLGSCFHNNSDTTGYEKVITAWHELYFFSPIIAAIQFTILFVIRACRIY